METDESGWTIGKLVFGVRQPYGDGAEVVLFGDRAQAGPAFSRPGASEVEAAI